MQRNSTAICPHVFWHKYEQLQSQAPHQLAVAHFAMRDHIGPSVLILADFNLVVSWWIHKTAKFFSYMLENEQWVIAFITRFSLILRLELVFL